MLLRESLEEKPLEEEYFSQRAIANDETWTKIAEQLDPLDLALEVYVINENYEISINFVNTRKILNINLLVIDDELP